MRRLGRLLAAVGGLALAGSAWAQNRAVDTDGAIDLHGVVVLPSGLAVLLLVLAAVLVALLVALLARRAEERREAEETRRHLVERLEAQEQELAQLRTPLRGGARSTG